MFSAGRMVSKSDLSYCATSDSKTLGALLYGKSASRRMLALTEIALRCDRSLKPKVRDNAVKGDLFAYDVFRLLDKTKTSLAALYKEAKPNTLTKAASAYDLLKLGDKRGAQCLDEAMDNPILFRKNHGNGWLDKTNAAFLLICYADGSNRALIAKHLTGPYPTIRRRYPELARLKRPNLDAELLKLTNHEYHGVRKWLAIAAKERPESRAYHRVLEQLSRDSNSEVSAAALWALGKGERP